MKKFSKYLLIIILSLFIIPIVSVDVNAATLDVKTINASITNNKISVDGTVDNGVLAVAIMVYEEDGTTLVTMKTTSVDSNDKYSDTIDVTAGKKYIVKAANYDGGEYITKKVTEETKKEDEKPDTETKPDTNTITDNTITDTNVTAEENTTNETNTTNTISSNPKTGDNIILFAIIFIIALTGLVGTVIINKKRTKKSK